MIWTAALIPNLKLQVNKKSMWKTCIAEIGVYVLPKLHSIGIVLFTIYEYARTMRDLAEEIKF